MKSSSRGTPEALMASPTSFSRWSVSYLLMSEAPVSQTVLIDQCAIQVSVATLQGVFHGLANLARLGLPCSWTGWR